VRESVSYVHAHTGLLIKQILVSAADTSSVERGLVDNTRGVLFYSVPHNGSSLADYSSRPTAAYLLYPSVEVRDLRAGLFIVIVITSGQSNLTTGCIAAARGRFNGIHQVASVCTPV